ncbi:IS110 family transposase [Methylosinus sporium]|uniref:IS110 family transposase n=1 Tax=Methylosinus sporium TaxID=428 RepID=UPI00383A4DDA
MKPITIGLDIAKNVFQLHGMDASGKRVLSARLRRDKVEKYFAALAPCMVAMEACGSAHHWARVIGALGHETRLVPPAYVKPFVKRNKTDARDAEAICEAALRPSMRFVAVKSVEQQSARALQRARDLLVRQRTQLGNCLRGLLAEMGVVAAKGAAGLAELALLVEDGKDPRVPASLHATLATLARQWRALEQEARALEKRIVASARADEKARLLMAIPGVGPMTAQAVIAAIGDGRQFLTARDFAAWVGLTPRQYASGEKSRSGRISRAGDPGLRRLLTLGASAHLRQARAKPERMGPWLAGVLARRPTRVAVVAQAAKTARIIWAMLTSGESFRARPATA